MDVLIHHYLDYLTPPFWADSLRAMSFAAKRATGYYVHPTFWLTLVAGVAIYSVVLYRKRQGEP